MGGVAVGLLATTFAVMWLVDRPTVRNDQRAAPDARAHVAPDGAVRPELDFVAERHVASSGGSVSVVFEAAGLGPADVVFQAPAIRVSSGDEELFAVALDGMRARVALEPGDYGVDWGDDAWRPGKTTVAVPSEATEFVVYERR